MRLRASPVAHILVLVGAIFWLFCAERKVRPVRVCNECAKKRAHIGERENSEGVCFQTFWFVAVAAQRINKSHGRRRIATERYKCHAHLQF